MYTFVQMLLCCFNWGNSSFKISSQTSEGSIACSVELELLFASFINVMKYLEFDYLNELFKIINWIIVLTIQTNIPQHLVRLKSCFLSHSMDLMAIKCLDTFMLTTGYKDRDRCAEDEFKENVITTCILITVQSTVGTLYRVPMFHPYCSPWSMKHFVGFFQIHQPEEKLKEEITKE